MDHYQNVMNFNTDEKNINSNNYFNNTQDYDHDINSFGPND